MTLVAPAGLGVRDAAFAWAVKAALPSRSFAVGSLIAIVVRAVLTVVEVLYVGAVTALGRRHGWGVSGRRPPDPGRPRYSGTRLRSWKAVSASTAQASGGRVTSAASGSGPDQVPGQQPAAGDQQAEGGPAGAAQPVGAAPQTQAQQHSDEDRVGDQGGDPDRVESTPRIRADGRGTL